MPEIIFFFILYSFTQPTLTEGLLGSGVGTRFGGVKEKMTQSWPPEVCHLVATQTRQTLVTWQVDLHELGVVSPARGHLQLPRGCRWVGWGLRKQSLELRLGKKTLRVCLDGQLGEGILGGGNSIGKSLVRWHILETSRTSK